MRWLTTAVAVLGITCAARPGFSSGGWLPGSSTPGKNSAYSDFGFDGVPRTLFSTSAAIVKGKKKSVLVIEATVSLFTSTSMSVQIGAVVNGVGLPYPRLVIPQCAASALGGCVLAATFWLDVDVAEAANPGLFVRQPLNVVVSASPGVSTLGTLSIAVRQEKK